MSLPASVLREGSIIVVDFTAHGVEDDVLEDGSETDGVENIRFLLRRETNALGVALGRVMSVKSRI